MYNAEALKDWDIKRNSS